MKQNLLFISSIATIAMFASCSSDSLLSDTAPASDPTIKFNTSMKNITRAVTTDATFSSFKVSAYEQGSTEAYFDKKTVSKGEDSKWAPTEGDLYWPKSGKALDFFAYAPTELSATTASTGISISGFNLPTTEADQTDILVAKASKQYDASSSADNTVSLNFKHALSNIVIKARNETSGAYTVKVKGVRVGKVYSTGNFSFDGTNCTWSNHATKTDYAIGGRDDATYSELEVTKDNSSSGNSSDLMNGKELLIIPQDATTNAPWKKEVENNDGSRISICCQLWQGSTRIFPASDKTVEYGWISVPLPATYDWQAGNKYIYTVRFFPNGGGDTGNVDPEDPEAGGGESGTDPIPSVKIEFTAVINNWTNGNGTGENIPSE